MSSPEGEATRLADDEGPAPLLTKRLGFGARFKAGAVDAGIIILLAVLFGPAISRALGLSTVGAGSDVAFFTSVGPDRALQHDYAREADYRRSAEEGK